MTLTADLLRELPTSGNALSILETMQAESIADRFNSGGLSAGGTSHLVALLGSRAQTRYRVGDVDIASPTTGAPLLFPELAFWQHVDSMTGLMPAETNAQGLAISLDPVRPATRWMGTAEGFASSPRLVSAAATSAAPPIARLHDWTHGSVLLSGPLGRRSGVIAGGASSESGAFVRGQHDLAREHARSAFAHFTFAPAAGREVRTLGWFQAVRAPAPHATASEQTAAHDSAIHLQSTFETSINGRTRWRVFGGYTQRRREEELSSTLRVADRLVGGPIPDLVASADSLERRWQVGMRAAPIWRGGRHHANIGVDYAVTAVRASAPPASLISELVDGLPARVWAYMNSGLESNRHATSIAAFASDRFELSPTVILDAALGVESIAGTTAGSITRIVWHSLLPRASVRWELGTRPALTFFTGYRRSANQLALDLLSHGDPAAPVASVFRWDSAMEAAGALVARAGPGTGGDPEFSGIDPRVKRPHTDEFVIALESRPSRASQLRVAGIARREASLVNVVNVGVPITSYRMFSIPDANVDLAGSSDDQALPVYERLPDTFGRDRYLLTNPPEQTATMGAVVVTAQVTTKRLFLLVGATASAVVGPGSSRGFRAIENDQDAAGEIFSNPNASTNARGRLFSDRAYTIKWTTVYRFPRDVRLGAIARYQDGQPFSRLVIVPGLTQGVEAIQAFANGRSRFAFTGTLDIRLQKGVALGRGRLDVVLDIYNLLNMQKEVEEYVVTGARFRTPTATQPPRAVHAGLRVTF